jgi:hypothetical protein
VGEYKSTISIAELRQRNEASQAAADAAKNPPPPPPKKP